MAGARSRNAALMVPWRRFAVFGQRGGRVEDSVEVVGALVERGECGGQLVDQMRGLHAATVQRGVDLANDRFELTEAAAIDQSGQCGQASVESSPGIVASRASGMASAPAATRSTDGAPKMLVGTILALTERGIPGA